MEKKILSEADVIAVTTDFETGDYVYFQALNGNLFFGKIMTSAQDRIVLRSVHGKMHIFTDSSKITLKEALKRMGKPLDVNNVYEGDIISTIVQTVSGGFYRQYAEISQTIGDTALGIKYLRPIEPPGTFGYAAKPEHIYATDEYSTLEEKMFSWELEA